MTEQDRIIIFKRVLNGESFTKIAKDFNLSGSRISQIFYKLTRILKHPRLMPEEVWGTAPRSQTIVEFRADKDFWLGRIEEYKEKIKPWRSLN